MLLMPANDRKPPPLLYRLRITLLGITPPIWRLIHVPSTIPLCCLHDAIQAVMGWSDSHLHQFEKNGKFWGIPQDYADDDLNVADEGGVPLRKLLHGEGDSLTYVYDFGDNWQHEVLLEQIVPSTVGPARPFCLGGERQCPPEDVGGVPGYEEFLEIIFDPGHKDFEHLVTWAGGPFQAEDFDATAVNAVLSRMRWPIRHRRPDR